MSGRLRKLLAILASRLIVVVGTAAIIASATTKAPGSEFDVCSPGNLSVDSIDVIYTDGSAKYRQTLLVDFAVEDAAASDKRCS